MDDPPLTDRPPSAQQRRRSLDVIRDRLFADSDQRTWAVLDGARVERLVRELETQRVESVCLYAGDLEPSMARVAPYLTELQATAPFTQWLLERGWGRSWGIFLRSPADMQTLRKHLRRHLRARDPEGRTLLFRYYDPRVLRLFLPTCNAAETAELFGPITTFAMESEDASELLLFSRTESPPRAERVTVVAR